MEQNSIANHVGLLQMADSLTVDDLLRMMPELEAKFPKENLPPNPADVHPATFSALHRTCSTSPDTIWADVSDRFMGIVLHVRTDVEPWKLHKCTCKEHGK